MPKDRIMDGFDPKWQLIRERTISKEKVSFYYRGTQLYAADLENYSGYFYLTEGSYVSFGKRKYNNPHYCQFKCDPSENFDLGASHPEIITESMLNG